MGWLPPATVLLIPEVPPRKVTVNVVFALRFAAGTMVIVLVPLPVTVAAITPPPVRASVAVVVLAFVTGTLNVAWMVGAFRVTFAALAAGVMVSTVGAAVAACVVKLHEVVGNAPHGVFCARMPVDGQVPPVITTVYTLEDARFRSGLIVTVFVVLLKVTLTGTLVVPLNNLT